jgi:hypothetical protein
MTSTGPLRRVVSVVRYPEGDPPDATEKIVYTRVKDDG